MQNQSHEFNRVYNALRASTDGLFTVSNATGEKDEKYDLQWVEGQISSIPDFKRIDIVTRIGHITIEEHVVDDTASYKFLYGSQFGNCFNFLPGNDRVCHATDVDRFFEYDNVYSQLVGLLEGLRASLINIETSMIVDITTLNNAFNMLNQPLVLFEFDKVFADYFDVADSPLMPYAAGFENGLRTITVRTVLGTFKIQEFRNRVGNLAMREPAYTVTCPETFPFEFPQHLREHGLHLIFDKNRWDTMSISMVTFFAQLMLSSEGKWLVPKYQLVAEKSEREIVLELFANMFKRFTNAPIWSPIQVSADPIGVQSIQIKLPDGPDYIYMSVKSAEQPFVRTVIPERIANRFLRVDSSHPEATTRMMMREIFGKELDYQ